MYDNGSAQRSVHDISARQEPCFPPQFSFGQDDAKALHRLDNPDPRYGKTRAFFPLEFLALLTVHVAQPYEKIRNYHGYNSCQSNELRKEMNPPRTPRATPTKTPTPHLFPAKPGAHVRQNL